MLSKYVRGGFELNNTILFRNLDAIMLQQEI